MPVYYIDGEKNQTVKMNKQLKRIADAMEEILRLIKKDMKTINEAARPEKRPRLQ